MLLGLFGLYQDRDEDETWWMKGPLEVDKFMLGRRPMFLVCTKWSIVIFLFNWDSFVE